ncbi:hypothetical protein MMC28_001033 [Mycoblastus sanguinarius]|nr:hypothetical protein [Mycoblastus sanguinarius]
MGSHYDLVIIGAGLQGLAAGKTFLQLEPDLNLLIVDSNETVGGVWAKENLYPGLSSNNLLGTYEYTDFPMDESFGVKKEEHIPGEVIYEYLQRYAEKFDLTRRIEFWTKVKVAEKVEEGWKLDLETAASPLEKKEGERRPHHLPVIRKIFCAKLIVATGLTSTPASINIRGSEQFDAPIVNFGDYARESPQLYENKSIETVTVYGGGKASYDIVYLMSTYGKRVNWIIRASGHGPTYMVPSHVYIGPFRCWFEKVTTTRPLTWFSPCVWGDADGFSFVRNFLHCTTWGRWVVDTFWAKIGSDLITQTGIAEHEETKKLIPDQPPFWYGVSLSILNYPSDIYGFVRSGQVKVLRKDVKCLEGEKRIRFEDGTTVQTDALICSMGWKFRPTIEFRPKEIHAELGVPSADYTPTQREMWDKLEARADVEVFERFPKLLNGPKMDQDSLMVEDNLPHADFKNFPRKEVSPWRLFRGIAPPALLTRDIVFLGMVFNIQGAVRSEISSIWAYAYMNDKLPDQLASIRKPSQNIRLPVSISTEKSQTAMRRGSLNEMLYDTALFNRFGKWRTPYGFGARNPDLVFEGILYFDMLLQDLGLRSWRKGWGWFGEVFGGSYGQADYRGLVEEWQQNQRRKSPLPNR